MSLELVAFQYLFWWRYKQCELTRMIYSQKTIFPWLWNEENPTPSCAGGHSFEQMCTRSVSVDGPWPFGLPFCHQALRPSWVIRKWSSWDWPVFLQLFLYYIFQNAKKREWEEWHGFPLSWISLVYGLIGSSWIHVSASTLIISFWLKSVKKT